MLCPFCGEKMEAGRLFNGRRDISLFWMPSGYDNRRYFFRSFDKVVKEHGGLFVDTVPFRKEGSFLNASICRKCKKIIADINEEP